MALKKQADLNIKCQNFIDGKWQFSKEKKPIEIFSPWDGKKIGLLYHSNENDIDNAVLSAQKAQKAWGEQTIKARAQVMLNLRQYLCDQIDTFSHVISRESGKLLDEAKAGVLKGIEVLDYAFSIQNIDVGGKLTVSNGVTCEFRREPLGVVAGITPFNFPFMVPMWMIPIAVT
ncbi:MAG: aldehyde dehydrogenase family protein, partial [Silvanigrellaceae bacterium]|nr:aldehyde dehydrogenase family protein [Silvanigrellaceae bacterium]